jgi:phosphotransferase system HPr (HPr) family protein
MVEATITVLHHGGLHLRAAARLVQTAATFQSTVQLRNLARTGSQPVDAKSLFAVMQSGVSQGQQIWIGANGPDEDAAVAALRALIERDFEGI